MRTVVDPAFRAELVRRILDAGTTQATLARDAHVSPGYLSEIINGRKSPSTVVAQALDDALAAGGTLAGLVHPLLTDDDTDRWQAATSSSQPGPAAIDGLAHVLAAQRALDDQLGSAAMVKPVGVQLDQVLTLATNSRGPHRAKLVHVAAQYAQFAGWLATSTAQWDAARKHFHTALQLATENGDRDMIATVLSYQGHVAWLTCQATPAINLTEAALRHPGIYPGQLAYDSYALARGLALTGDLKGADRHYGLGDEYAALNDTYSGETPPWQYYRAPWFWDLERGIVHRYAARHQPHRIHAAVDLLQAGLDGCPVEWRQADWFAEYVVHHATALAAAGDLNGARDQLGKARRIAEGVGSKRILGAVASRETKLSLR